MKAKMTMATVAVIASLLVPVVSRAAGNASNGATLYASKCAMCHGAKAQGGAGPALNPVPSNFDSVAPTMPPGSSTSASDVADIKAYLTSLSSGGSGSTQGSQPATSTTQTSGGGNAATGGGSNTAPAATPASSTKTGSDANLLLAAGAVALVSGLGFTLRRRSA